MSDKSSWRKAKFNAIDKRRKQHKLEAARADEINLAKKEGRVEAIVSMLKRIKPVYDSAKELKEESDYRHKQQEHNNKIDGIVFSIMFGIFGIVCLILAVLNYQAGRTDKATLMLIACIASWSGVFIVCRRLILKYLKGDGVKKGA